jgi:hypothetical protein
MNTLPPMIKPHFGMAFGRVEPKKVHIVVEDSDLPCQFTDHSGRIADLKSGYRIRLTSDHSKPTVINLDSSKPVNAPDLHTDLGTLNWRDFSKLLNKTRWPNPSPNLRNTIFHSYHKFIWQWKILKK